MDPAVILIVDDEAMGREAMQSVLFMEGYQLIFAENGAEALDKARRSLPDIILLDVMMPVMDGYEVCRRMREDPLLADLPILIVTALDDRSSTLRGIEAGADDFISKPVDRLELRARVRTIIRLNRHRRLLLERARFAWVVDKAQEGYLILDDDDLILYANPTARVQLNLPAGRMGEPFRAFVRSQFSAEPEAAWDAWPEYYGSPLFLIKPETRLAPPTWLHIDVLDVPAGVSGGRLVCVSDVTDRLALHKEVWSFHRMMTHKLRTPVANFVMAAELLERQAEETANSTLKELASTVLISAKRFEDEVLAIVQHLNTPRMTRTGSLFALQYLEPLTAQICEALGALPAVVLFEQPELKEQTLSVSYRAIEVILRELLENSKKFHPELDPKIDIVVSSVVEDRIRVSIRDNGVHLSPEQLEQVWLPYYQAEKEFSGEVAGMGLGLSTVAMLVWEAGGKCRMLNREDRPGVVVELDLNR